MAFCLYIYSSTIKIFHNNKKTQRNLLDSYPFWPMLKPNQRKQARITNATEMQGRKLEIGVGLGSN